MKKILLCMCVFAAFLLISCAASLSNMSGSSSGSDSSAGYSDLLNSLFIQTGVCKSGNCINGTGTYASEDGLSFTGKFVNGRPDGEGTVTFKSGLKYTLTYKNGKPADGPVTVFSSTGAVIKTLYIRNGKLSAE